MQVTLVAGGALSPAHQERWGEIQALDPALASPVLSCDFVRAVAAVRDDVEVAVLEAEGRIVGFFAFERKRFGGAGPVGGQLSDFQAVVAEPGFDWDPRELLRACGLKLWEFDHLLAGQAPFVAHHDGVADSPEIGLAGGFEVYRERLRERGSKVVAKMERYARKLAEKEGPLRFVADDPDRAALAFVIARKSEQCRRTGTFDFFGLDWTVALVEALHETHTPAFAGRLSTLRAGDTILAAHMGLRSPTVWHWWFPVYDDRYSSHSPGGILLLRAIQHACDEGIERIDLGKGDDFYKQRFMTGAVPVAEGQVALPSLLAWARGARRASERLIWESPLADLAREPVRALRRRRRSAKEGAE